MSAALRDAEEALAVAERELALRAVAWAQARRRTDQALGGGGVREALLGELRAHRAWVEQKSAVRAAAGGLARLRMTEIALGQAQGAARPPPGGARGC